MVKFDREIDLVTVVGLEGGVLVAVSDGDFLENPDKFFRRILLPDAGGLNQKDKRC